MKVTVYIPTYNRPHLLKRAVESVLKQTYQDIEIIVVNDGEPLPPDLLNYLTENAVTCLKTDGNQRACVARNIAILASSGDYVTGLDDDDCFEINRIEEFVQAAKQQPAKMFFTGYQFIEKRLTKKRMPSMTSVALDDILKANVINNQVFAPRSFYIEAGLFDEALPAWQDFDMWVRMIAKFGDAILIPNYSYIMDGSEDVRISKKKENIMQAIALFQQKHKSLYGSDNELKAHLLFNKQSYFQVPFKIEDIIEMYKHLSSIKISRLMLEKSLFRLTGLKI